ncbi:MAG TPA: sulfur transferase domain-containing protein [Gemmatimonadales bacterium]|nr:sulfur transferase domain-containing protein [Gemmatimonadales bacterium]
MAPLTSTLLSAVAGLPNAAEPVPGWITGGQPTELQFKAFKAAGGEVVLDNRDPMEPRPFDEPATARASGLEYHTLPIVHGAVTQDTMKSMHEMLRRLTGRKALLHCSSGNRTSAALIPYLMLEKKMAEEDAVETAMRGGLRSAELMELAVQYAHSLSC